MKLSLYWMNLVILMLCNGYMCVLYATNNIVDINTDCLSKLKNS